MWCHPYSVYDYTSSIFDFKPVKTAISSTLYVITPSLSKTSHLFCKASQVAYVCHHMRYTWHHIHTLWHQPLLFMTSNAALYSLYHTHYIWHLLYTVWCHIHYVCYITQWLSLWHQTLYVYDIFTWYGITLSVGITQPLCAFTATMPEVTLSVFLTLHTMYQLYEKNWMYVITAYICMTPYVLHMTSLPRFMESHHFIYDVMSTISNITFTLSDRTSTVSMSSNPLSQWCHIHPMYDITYSIHVTSYPPYLWHHIHYVRQHNMVCCWYHTRHMCDIICTTDDIISTLSHQSSVYDVTSTTGMTWHPLY